jgi:hypothetical protein
MQSRDPHRTPDQRRTTPQVRRAAQHPGNETAGRGRRLVDELQGPRPVRPVKRLGENLVLFRNQQGRTSARAQAIRRRENNWIASSLLLLAMTAVVSSFASVSEAIQ